MSQMIVGHFQYLTNLLHTISKTYFAKMLEKALLRWGGTKGVGENNSMNKGKAQLNKKHLYL